MSNKERKGLDSLSEMSSLPTVAIVTRLKNNDSGDEVYMLGNGKIAFLDRDRDSKFKDELEVGGFGLCLINKDMGNYGFITANIGRFPIVDFLEKMTSDLPEIDKRRLIIYNILDIPDHICLREGKLKMLESLQEHYDKCIGQTVPFNVSNKILYLDMIAEDVNDILNDDTYSIITSKLRGKANDSANNETHDADYDNLIKDLHTALDILKRNGVSTVDVEYKIRSVETSSTVKNKLKDLKDGDKFLCTIKGLIGNFVAEKEPDNCDNEYTPISFPKGLYSKDVSVIVIDEILTVNKIEG